MTAFWKRFLDMAFVLKLNPHRTVIPATLIEGLFGHVTSWLYFFHYHAQLLQIRKPSEFEEILGRWASCSLLMYAFTHKQIGTQVNYIIAATSVSWPHHHDYNTNSFKSPDVVLFSATVGHCARVLALSPWATPCFPSQSGEWPHQPQLSSTTPGRPHGGDCSLVLFAVSTSCSCNMLHCWLANVTCLSILTLYLGDTVHAAASH